MKSTDKRIVDNVSVDSAVAVLPGVKGSYIKGTEQLLDLFHGPVGIRPIAVHEITRLSFSRAGQALRQSMGKARARRDE
jgi:hypothetical protein